MCHYYYYVYWSNLPSVTGPNTYSRHNVISKIINHHLDTYSKNFRALTVFKPNTKYPPIIQGKLEFLSIYRSIGNNDDNTEKSYTCSLSTILFFVII